MSRKTAFSRRTMILLCCILLLGVSLRLIDFWRTADFVSPDAIGYSMWGTKFLHTGIFSWAFDYKFNVTLAPLFPLLIAGVSAVLPVTPIAAAKVVSLLFSILSLPLLFFLARRLGGDKAGLVIAFLYALMPDSIIQSSTGTMESTVLFLVLLYSLLWFSDKRLSQVASGIVLGLAVLLRSEGVVIFAIPLATLAYAVYRGGFRQRLLTFVGSCIIFLVVISPYIYYLTAVTNGEHPLGVRDVGTIMGLRGLVTPLAADAYSYTLKQNGTTVQNAETGGPGFFAIWTADPVGQVRAYVDDSVRQLLYVAVIGAPFFLFVVYALWRKTPLDKSLAFSLAAYAIILLLMYPLLFSSQRFVVLPILLLMLASAGALLVLPRRLLVLFLVIALVILLVRDVRYVMRDVPSHAESTDAGLFIRDYCHTDYGFGVMSRSSWPAYYAVGEHLPFPFANVTDLVHYAALYHTRFVVVESAYISDWPSFASLWRLNDIQGVSLVHETIGPSPARVFILPGPGTPCSSD